MLEDEQKRDISAYEKWYKEFSIFIKEGVMTDADNNEQLLRLMRYSVLQHGESASGGLEDYKSLMKEKQRNIYDLPAQNESIAMSSTFMKPFKNTEVPLLIVDAQFDEMIFKQIGAYKGYTFVNIEQATYEEL